VVQGGFIISKLPEWLEQSKFIEQPFIKEIPYAFSALGLDLSRTHALLGRLEDSTGDEPAIIKICQGVMINRV